MVINLIYLALAALIILFIIQKIANLAWKIILTTVIFYIIAPHLGLLLQNFGNVLANNDLLPKFSAILTNLGACLIF